MPAPRLLYLDWLRGVAVIAMVLAHVIDSWTREADRNSVAFLRLFFIGGVASPLFLFLAGAASAMSGGSKARKEDHRAGARAVRRRGWQIFLLGLVFRVQAQLLGMGPFENVFKVDMLNIMGLSMVVASWLWQAVPDRARRVWLFAVATAAITTATPLVRATPLLAGLPDPLEAYLRPASGFAAFPLFPWAGFLFAGILVGDLIDGVRVDPRRERALQLGVTIAASLGIWMAWWASFLPAVFTTASFWHDSPTFFVIRLGLVALTIPAASIICRLVTPRLLQPVVVLGRSSLFVYWIHVEMVYGVIAEPLKKGLPLWASLAGTAALLLLLYGIVLLKNRWLDKNELKGPFRLLSPVVR